MYFIGIDKFSLKCQAAETQLALGHLCEEVNIGEVDVWQLLGYSSVCITNTVVWLSLNYSFYHDVSVLYSSIISSGNPSNKNPDQTTASMSAMTKIVSSHCQQSLKISTNWQLEELCDSLWTAILNKVIVNRWTSYWIIVIHMAFQEATR